MKKRKIITLLLTITISLTIITNATAINITQKQTTKNNNKQNNKKIPYVDPKIHLTKTQLPKLKRALEKIEEPEYKQITQKIIKIIETKGIVESYDIKNILVELKMLNTEIYSGMITGGAGYDCTLHSFPLIFIPCFPPIWGWLGLAVYLRWKCAPNPQFDNNYMNLKINGVQLKGWHNGFALSPVGAWVGQQVIYSKMRSGSTLTINAFSPFIMITYT